MAAHRHLSTSALVVVLVFLLAALPGLFLLQVMVRKARKDEPHLVATLVVRLNDRAPQHLDLHLEPGSAGDGRLAVQGTGRLRAGTFPWKEAPFEGTVVLDLASGPLSHSAAPFRMRTTDSELVASYRERFLGSAEPALPPAACIGQLEVSKLTREDGQLDEWGQVRQLQGVLELRCHGPGRDERPGTEDDLEFTLLGTLDHVYGAPS